MKRRVFFKLKIIIILAFSMLAVIGNCSDVCNAFSVKSKVEKAYKKKANIIYNQHRYDLGPWPPYSKYTYLDCDDGREPFYFFTMEHNYCFNNTYALLYRNGRAVKIGEFRGGESYLSLIHI